MRFVLKTNGKNSGKGYGISKFSCNQVVEHENTQIFCTSDF